MAQVRDFLSGADIQQLSNLQVLARLVVEGFCAGLHRSPHKGFSVEFRQHRQYVPGDEIRRLDWKVYGKSDRFYIREYEEETNLRATLFLDCSGSMNYTSGGLTKHAYGMRLAACLAYLMLGQGDGVGLLTFSDRLGEYVPPRSRPGHLQVLLEAMAHAPVAGETELGKVFHEVIAKIQRRGLLIIISDCFGDVPQLLSALAHFRHAHHEVVILQLWDRAELEFPFQRWVRFESLETPDQHHLVDPAHLRQTYLARLAAFRAELQSGCHRHRVDLVPLVTDQPYADALAHYLTWRRKRG